MTDTGQSVDGTFKQAYIGTLENEGPGLAPFHDFDSQVPPELKAQLEQIRRGSSTARSR